MIEITNTLSDICGRHMHALSLLHPCMSMHALSMYVRAKYLVVGHALLVQSLTRMLSIRIDFHMPISLEHIHMLLIAAVRKYSITGWSTTQVELGPIARQNVITCYIRPTHEAAAFMHISPSNIPSLFIEHAHKHSVRALHVQTTLK
jgi:hypothetical protein